MHVPFRIVYCTVNCDPICENPCFGLGIDSVAICKNNFCSSDSTMFSNNPRGRSSTKVAYNTLGTSNGIFLLQQVVHLTRQNIKTIVHVGTRCLKNIYFSFFLFFRANLRLPCPLYTVYSAKDSNFIESQALASTKYSLARVTLLLSLHFDTLKQDQRRPESPNKTISKIDLVCLPAPSEVDHFSNGPLNAPKSLLRIRLVPVEYTG